MTQHIKNYLNNLLIPPYDHMDYLLFNLIAYCLKIIEKSVIIMLSFLFILFIFITAIFLEILRMTIIKICNIFIICRNLFFGTIRKILTITILNNKLT
jgi:hypothetical protein